MDILQSNARTTNAEIARQVDMAPSAVLERVRKLEERGFLTGYTARLEPQKLGLGLLAFIAVRGDERVSQGSIGEALAAIPEVQEVHHVAGEDCYLVKVRLRDTEALGRLLRERIRAIPDVSSTRSTIVLASLKETGTIALDHLEDHADEQ